MLDVCAPGYTAKRGQHNWIITYDDSSAFLPSGQHSRQRSGRGEVQGRRFVKALIRRFQIDACAEDELPQLRQ